MKPFKRAAAVLLILGLNFGLVWAMVGYFAAPLPNGESYRQVTGWPKLPGGVGLGQVSGVGVDSRGNVFVFHRAERIWQGEELELRPIASPTVLVFDEETGELVRQWGANTFVMPHGLTVDAEDNLWLTDVGLHQVFKFDPTDISIVRLADNKFVEHWDEQDMLGLME